MRSAGPCGSAHEPVYVVLGGLGYIGSAVVQALLRRGDQVVVVDRTRRDDLPLFALDGRIPPGAAGYAQVDLLDHAALAAVLREIAARWRALVVIHLVGLFVKDPGKRTAVCANDYVQHNVVTTEHIVEVLNELEADVRFIYQSAGGAYRTFLD
ncbi:MAG: NAD-dependent epimerase/dehydratase family protein, partial [bacterium]